MTDNLIDKGINDRIAEVIQGDGRSQLEIGKDLKIQRTQLGRIVGGKLNPTLEQVCAIASHYKLRTGWIISGELPKLTKEKSGVSPDYVMVLLNKELEVFKSNMLGQLEQFNSKMPASANDTPAGPGHDIVPTHPSGAVLGKKKKSS